MSTSEQTRPRVITEVDPASMRAAERAFHGDGKPNGDSTALDPRTAHAVESRKVRIDRAYLTQWLASPEGRAALKARPGFGMPGVAVLPPTPRSRTFRTDPLALRTVGHHRRNLRYGKTDGQLESARLQTMRAVKRLQGNLSLPVTPEEASAVILHARTLREAARAYGLPEVAVKVTERAERRARDAQRSQRPVK